MIALNLALKNNYDIILSDIKMPKLDGAELLNKLFENNISSAIIMMSGHGNIETAVNAVKIGAYDYLAKPLDLNRLLVSTKDALEITELVSETKNFKKKISKSLDMIGSSTSIENVKQMIEKVAPTDTRVLITGSNRSGKEVIAKLPYDSIFHFYCIIWLSFCYSILIKQSIKGELFRFFKTKL